MAISKLAFAGSQSAVLSVKEVKGSNGLNHVFHFRAETAGVSAHRPADSALNANGPFKARKPGLDRFGHNSGHLRPRLRIKLLRGKPGFGLNPPLGYRVAKWVDFDICGFIFNNQTFKFIV